MANPEELKNKIEKLPKWAQEYIRDIERGRDIAIRALNEYCDSQTPSEFFIEEMESTGEGQGPSIKVRYIQTRRISVVHDGVQLDVGIDNAKELTLQWYNVNRRCGDVAFIPESYQRARLLSKQNMMD